MNDFVGLRLAAGDIAALEARTEGWIAGLQLAALSLRGKDSAAAADFIAAFSGTQQFVLDYLAEEVFQQQSQLVQTFMLETAILDRLCGPLCDAVTQPERDTPDGQSTLEGLVEANLFVLPLDEERRWFRYHRLFADLLRQRLERMWPDEIAGLHRRAAGWLAANGVDGSGPPWFMIYYIILALFLGLAVIFGRRAGCHTIYWMAPFMILGRWLRNRGRWPSLRLEAEPSKCSDCLTCTRGCPMSLDVHGMVQRMDMEDSECILCGSCVDGCSKGAIRFTFSASGLPSMPRLVPDLEQPH